MQKRGYVLVVFSALFLMLISIASAAQIASISDLLQDFGGENLFLIAIFLISLILIFAALFKFFDRGSTSQGASAFALLISLPIALLITYGFAAMNWDIEGFFYELGVSLFILQIILVILIIIGIIFLSKKIGLGWVSAILGIFLILIASVTDWIYEKESVLTLGIIMMIIPLLWKGYKFFLRKKNN